MYQVVTDNEMTDWVRSAFLIPKGPFDEELEKYRNLPDGLFKFADTTLGGNAAINPLPQYTGFADLNEKRYTMNETELYSFLSTSDNMGRTYSERFDRNQVLMHIRFGVPTFNNMTTFFANAYHPEAAALANKARTNEWARTIGRIIGTVATFRVLPYILVGQALRFLFDMPTTKYYYLKPAMNLYNQARSQILTTFASNAGFIAGMSNTERPMGIEAVENPNSSDPGIWKRLAPDIYNSNGSIDIYKVTTRYQRLANQRLMKLQEVVDGLTDSEQALEAVAEVYRKTGYKDDPIVEGGRDMEEYWKDYLNLPQYQPLQPKETDDPNKAEDFTTRVETNIATQPGENVEDLLERDDKGWWERFRESLTEEQRDGGQFVSFRIDNPGSTSFSANSTVAESGLSEAIKGMSSGARNMRFNLADGNLTGGLIGKAVGAVTGAVSGLISGVAESIGVSGLAMLMGNAIVDIPKHWQETVTQAPRVNCKFQLRCWSSDPISRYQNLMVPISSVMAGGLPRSTGHQSYVGPFICEYYCKGRGQSRLGIMDSFTISVGTGNIGYTNLGEPLGFDVEFNLIDLSDLIHMPITAGFKALDMIFPGGVSKHLFSDENSFTDLMAVLSSMDLVDQIYTTRRLKKNFHRLALNFEQWRSPAHWASQASNAGWLFGAQGGRMLSAFANVTDRG